MKKRRKNYSHRSQVKSRKSGNANAVLPGVLSFRLETLDIRPLTGILRKLMNTFEIISVNISENKGTVKTPVDVGDICELVILRLERSGNAERMVL